MKKLLALFLLICTASAFASTAPLKIINNTPFYVNYQLITYPIAGAGNTPQLASTGIYQGLITLAPFATVNYDVPGANGLPFDLLPSWDLNTNANPVSGGYAYATYGNRQRWGKFKFFISNNPYDYSTSKLGANIGPIGDAMSGNQGGFNFTWTTTGSGGVIVTIGLS